MCLIVLILLKESTSESMITRPCFQSSEHRFVTFVTCLLAAIFITDYKYHLLPSVLLAFYHLFAELVQLYI